MTIDVKVAFFFRSEYVLRRKRNSRTEFFEAECSLPIRHIERGDVDVAFRFPAAYGGSCFTEVLLSDQKLWWPMSFSGRPEEATLAQLQVKLLQHEVDLLGIAPRPPFDHAPMPFSDPDINRILSDETDAALTRAHKKLTENIMVCDGYVYALGGEPVYISAPSSASPPWSKLTPRFVNPGKDRAIDPSSTGLRWQPGDFPDGEVQACFRNRAFVPLRDRHALPSEAGDVLGALEISMNAPDNIDPLEVQVDACIRELWCLMHSVAWAVTAFSLSRHWGREPVRREMECLELAIISTSASIEPNSNRYETTLDRVAALEAFVAFVGRNRLNFHRTDLVRECRQTIEAFSGAERPARANALGKLTAEEEQAVASLPH